MRIVSKFSDYYDSVTKLGQYGGIQYIRETKVIENFEYHWAQIPQCDIIGFAGKIYLYKSTASDMYPYNHYYNKDCIKYYGKDEIFKYKKENYSWFAEKRFLDFADDVARHNDKWFNYVHSKYKQPSFYVDVKRKELIINPHLKTLEFYKVLDTYTAFQELAMWLSNQAFPDKPIPSVSNNDMIEAKGFDLKSSFRKDKKE